MYALRIRHQADRRGVSASAHQRSALSDPGDAGHAADVVGAAVDDAAGRTVHDADSAERAHVRSVWDRCFDQNRCGHNYSHRCPARHDVGRSSRAQRLPRRPLRVRPAQRNIGRPPCPSPERRTAAVRRRQRRR